MTPLNTILSTAINPALSLLPPQMTSDAVRVEMLAIGLQESNFTFRYQTVPGNPYAKGPARGFWQNELGGVQAVMTNSVTRDLAASLCSTRGVAYDADLVHAKLEFDDVLAAGFARLILWADPRPLPAMNDADGGWACYLRNWRPGRPRPDDWPPNHARALQEIGSPVSPDA